MIEWFEDLPKNCPPKEAFHPEGMVVYRFSFTNEPTEDDFKSQRYLKPENIFNGVSECIARSLSVFDNYEACSNMFKLPRIRKKFKSVLEIKLYSKDGLIKETFKKPNHYSWWRSNSFNFDAINKII